MMHRLRMALLTLFLFQAAAAWPVEVLSTAELASHCAYRSEDPGGPDAVFCIRYIQGFIDGAVATDERVTRNVVAEYEGDETFTERAIRTRGLHLRMEQFGTTYYAEFCLGEPVPLAEVVEVVVKDLESREVLDTQLRARDAVYYALRKAFPCVPGADSGSGD